MKRCPRCAGSGQDPEDTVEIQTYGNDDPHPVPDRCRACGGTGESDDNQMELG